MQSHIGPATQGQNSNPILAAIGKENSSRSGDGAREHESFQSVLADASEAANRDQTARNDTEAADANPETESPLSTEEEVANATTDEPTADGDEALALLADEADELVFRKKPNVPALKSGDVVQLVAEVAKGIETKSPPNASSHSPGQGDPAANRADTATPAWFPTSRSADAAKQATVAAKGLANGMPTPSDQAAIAKTIAADKAALRAERDVAVHGNGQPANQNFKQEIKGTEKPALPTAPAAAPNITPDEEPKHVTARRLSSEEPAPVFATQRNAATMVAGNPAFAAQLQTAANAAKPGMPVDERGVRWMSEASVTSEIAAQDVPATSRIQQANLLQQPDLPRNIAVQIAQAMRQGGGDRPMELVLSPAELGRVRISMMGGDGAMTVHVMADRPETLDLMRRHIDILAQEFHDIGYGTAEFAFGQNAADRGNPQDSDGGAGGLATSSSQTDATEGADTPAPTQLTLQSDRVDIRL